MKTSKASKKEVRTAKKAVKAGRAMKAKEVKAPKTLKVKVESAVRVLQWDPALWASVKAEAVAQGQGSRFVIDAAVQKQSADLVAELRGMGFNGERPAKRVRQQLNTSTLATLHAMSDQTDLPMVKLLQMAVARQIGGAK
jgi:hypothetical protein